MKEVTVIGSGNAFNSDGRAHACFLLENAAGEFLLLDAGGTSLYRLQQMRFDLNRIDRILLTHFHGDHFAGLPFILIHMSIVLGRTRPLTIAGPAGTEQAVLALTELFYPGLKCRFDLVFQEVPETGLELGRFRVTSVPVAHRPESVGYRIVGPTGKTFAFSGDASFDDNLLRLIDGADVAIIELTMERQTDPPTAHITLEELLAGRDRLKARRLVFSHIYDALAALAEKHGLGEAAFDGMKIGF